MSWQGILGHDDLVAQFRRSLVRHRLPSALLFVGPAGIGKRTFALGLAQTLLCQQVAPAEMAPCGTCPACQQVLAGTHPDLQMVACPPGKNVIPVETFIGSGERRMREGLCHEIALKPFMGGRKVAVIDDADYLATEGANCLLKTLEEPPPASLLILIGTSAEKQLPTIRSRCQTIRFQPLSADLLSQLLLQAGLAEDAESAQRIAEYSGGSLEVAQQMADPALWQFRKPLLGQLSQSRFDSVALANTVTAFVDDAGADAPSRRIRSAQVIQFAMDFYRELLRAFSGSTAGGDEHLQAAVAHATQHWTAGPLAAEACLLRCLEAQEQIGRNVNPATLLACWVDDLSRHEAGIAGA